MLFREDYLLFRKDYLEKEIRKHVKIIQQLNEEIDKHKQEMSYLEDIKQEFLKDLMGLNSDLYKHDKAVI